MFWSIELKHPCENHQHACYFHYFVIPYYQPSLVRKRPSSRWGVWHWPPVYWMAPVMISPFPARLVLVSHASELLQCSAFVNFVCLNIDTWICSLKPCLVSIVFEIFDRIADASTCLNSDSHCLVRSLNFVRIYHGWTMIHFMINQ